MVCNDEASLLLSFSRIIHSEHGFIFRVKLVSEINAPLLHPVVKITLGDLVGIIQYRMLRFQEGNLRGFVGYTIAADHERIRSYPARAQRASKIVGIVLYDEIAALVHIFH